ncbi:hypothetical protein MA16_Dca012316 [Dendrobium catenatum]|uniref:Uncharacterized protein n=1 Tax=Dendrobium catenatum TaxID=906689 RepID=A0A2I0WRC0_9ASPA|nr:hypothetical protein MA16_Dca012316 [Dendrobium catenatum]
MKLTLIAARPLEEEAYSWCMDQQGNSNIISGLMLQFLSKGQTTPSGPSGCTHNPINHGGTCP